MGNALTTFQTPTFGHDGNTHHIRVVDIGGEPWFLATDVCKALGLPFGNGAGGVGRYLYNLAEDERRLIAKCDLIAPSTFPNRGVTAISESGLYKLILRSDKPQAKPFQDWVTRVVLPAIRKDGGYIQGEEKVAKGEMSEDELVFRAMEVMKRKIDRLTAENKVMSDELNLVTVDEWRSLHHIYLLHGEKVKVGKLASLMATGLGVRLEKQTRKVRIANGETRETQINVYPRAILDKAGEQLGIIS